MVVPFYSLIGHYEVAREYASSYLREESRYFIVDASFNVDVPRGEGLYVYVGYGEMVIGNISFDVGLYSFSNLSFAGSVFGFTTDVLEVDECILGDYIARGYGLSVGDVVGLSFDGDTYLFRVVGLNKVFPVIVPWSQDFSPEFIIFSVSNVSSSEYGFLLGGYVGLFDELRDESSSILSLWSIPIYIAVLAGVFVGSLRLYYSLRYDIRSVHELGVGWRRIRFYLVLISMLLFILSIFVGLSLGIVISQVFGKVLYTFYGIVLYPVLSLDNYIQLFLTFFSISILSSISSFVLGGYIYGEAD
jgi:hypothetical protein